jgi:hypothetical protein
MNISSPFKISSLLCVVLLLQLQPGWTDILIDNFDDGNFTMETWDDGQWLGTDGSAFEDPVTGDGGTALRAAPALGVFDIFFVSLKAADIIPSAGGFAYRFGSDGITPASPVDPSLDFHTLILTGGFNRTATSDISANNYLRVTASNGGTTPTDATFYVSFTEGPDAACPTCPIVGQSNGPWIDPDGGGPMPEELGISITATPEVYIIDLADLRVDTIVDTLSDTAKGFVAACAGCPGAPGAADLTTTTLISFGYQRRGTEAGSNTMTVEFTIDDIILMENLPDVTTSSTISVDEVGAGSSDTFTVVLDAMPSHDVTISAVSSDTGEGTVTPASRTFTQANWDVPQTFTLNAVEDSITDGDQNYTIDLSITTSDLYYSTLTPTAINASTVDNGVPVTLSDFNVE